MLSPRPLLRQGARQREICACQQAHRPSLSLASRHQCRRSRRCHPGRGPAISSLSGDCCSSPTIRKSAARPGATVPPAPRTSHDVDALAAAQRDRSRTNGVTTTALAPRTRANTNAGLGTVDDVRLASRQSRGSPCARNQTGCEGAASSDRASYGHAQSRRSSRVSTASRTVTAIVGRCAVSALCRAASGCQGPSSREVIAPLLGGPNRTIIEPFVP
jgi:hypothetical protein